MANTPRIWHGGLKKALILEGPDTRIDRVLASLGIESKRVDRALSESELVDELANGQYNLLFKRSRTPVSRRAIEADPSLFAVMLCCIGDDSVDKEAAADSGVLVLNDPVSNGRSVAELMLGEMLCLARRLFDANGDTKAHRFSKSNQGRFELAGKTLGIFGLGNIGKQVAQLCEALGMEICFYDNREVAVEVGNTMNWRACNSLTELFRVAHVLVVHVPATDWRGRSNEHAIRDEHFEAMGSDPSKQPRIFLNAARGNLYPAEVLTRAAERGDVQAAMVDVFPSEPRSKDEQWVNPYAEFGQLFATPHIGAATLEAQPRIGRHIATTAQLFNDYGSVRNCVFRSGRQILTDASVGQTALCVVHSDKRGTKKAVDDAIYNAGASNLQSAHRDFPRYGVAYDLNILDQPLSSDQLNTLVEMAIDLSGDEHAIRSIRQFKIPDRST